MKVKNLDAYLPMPRIWLKIVISLMIKLAAGAAFYWAFHKEIAVHPNRVYFFGFLILVGIGFYWFGIVFEGRNPRSWLKEFWRRNVRGYSLLCVRHSNGIVSYEILNSNEVDPATKPALILKLGGCFKSLRSSYLGTHGWRARFTGLQNNTVIVRLTDRAGTSFTVSAAEALGALWEEMSSGGSSNGTWRGVFRLISVERDIYRRQVDEAWHQMAGLEWRLDWTRKALLSFHQRVAAAAKRKDFR